MQVLTTRVTKIFFNFVIVIYDIDDPADKIYLIKSGKAIVETLIQINEENTYPIVRQNSGKNHNIESS